jgi:dipeptidyl aminopeptidase/acylaminoacyl peptidase
MFAPLIPRLELFGNPSRFGPQLSPDGKQIAWLAPDGGVVNICVAGIDMSNPRFVSQDRSRGIYLFLWAMDSRHLIFLRDDHGNENRRIYLANLDTGEIHEPTPFEGIRIQQVFTDYHFPEEIMFGMNLRDRRFFDIYRYNIRTRDLRLEQENPGNYVSWLTDNAFRVRGALVAQPDGGRALLISKDAAAPPEIITAWGPHETQTIHGFTADNRNIYVSDNADSNTTCLYRWELVPSRRTALVSDPDADIAYVKIAPGNYEIQAVSWIKDRLQWKVLDPSVAEDFARLAKIHAGQFAVVSRDQADLVWLVLFFSDTEPGTYFMYDRATRTAVHLFSSFPDLSNFRLASVRPLTVTSRDGLKLTCYLTLPTDLEPKRLPLVINVHGGPWSRNYWQYDPEVQWLANRGYACLQVNFRGSTGFGKDFLNAANREWGRKMHWDLIDALDWTIREQIADPDRVCIFGRSYGGYAALAGLAFSPERFACGIDAMGPSNLITLLKATPAHWSTEKAKLRHRIGNEETEQEFLRSRSPLFFADTIRAPLLIAHGANDPRVKQTESDSMVAEIRKNKQKVEYLVFPDEGHELLKPENRLRFYAAAEKFMSEYLGGRVEAASPEQAPDPLNS